MDPNDPHGCTLRNDDLETLVAQRLQYIRLTQKFAEIANRAESIEDGFSDALRCFCHSLGWPIGHAYLATGTHTTRYVDGGIWCVAPGLDATPFVEASASSSFDSNGGFVGRAVAACDAVWIDEEITTPSFHRFEAARTLGLRCGLAFPILVQTRVVGVLEFFSDEARVCEDDLLDAVAQLGTQLGRVTERVEFERALARTAQEEGRRLGRELHDTLSQQLTGIGMLARSLERKLEDDDHVEHERAAALVDTIQDARQQLRAIARGLNPVDVDATSLRHAVAQFAADTEKTFGVPCRFNDDGAPPVDDAFTATQLFFIIREAVHNAAKHADATQISIAFAQPPTRELMVHVEDDGRGFDVATLEGNGMGLRTLRYRSRLIGARLCIESTPGHGTLITCSISNEKGRKP